MLINYKCFEKYDYKKKKKKLYSLVNKKIGMEVSP